MFIIKDILRVLKAFRLQFMWIGFLISFLVFLLNILFGLSFNINNFTKDVRHKLWIYFYIQEEWDIDEIYAQTMKLKEELSDNWLRVEFYSKEEAFRLLEKRMPDVIKNFEKYWIENPLPPTLYVIFDNNEKYNKLKEIVKKYKDLVTNTDDIEKWNSYEEQEARIKTVINLSNFIVMFSYFLIFILVIIIISFLMLIIRITFYNFYKQIEIEKLLWAFYRQIKLPFLVNIIFILIFSFILTLLYFGSFLTYLNWYFIKAFSIDLMSYVMTNSTMIFWLITCQIFTIIWITLLISNFFLNRLIKKI